MKKAEEIYKEYLDDSWLSVYDYQPMLNEFGEIILQQDDNQYSGDSRVIYKDGARYGFLIFGWGSCSGCDALQACRKISEVQELMDELNQQIKWFDSIEELKEYFRNKDWSLEWSWSADETKQFVENALLLQ